MGNTPIGIFTIMLSVAEKAFLLGEVITFYGSLFTPEQKKTFNETKWRPGKVIIEKVDIYEIDTEGYRKEYGTRPKVEKID